MANESGRGYNGRYSAMRRSLDLACQLLRSPEDRDGIRQEYSQLLYQREIANHLRISERYGVSPRVAVNAVGFAIRGYHDNHIYDAFEGLFNRDDLKRLETDHAARREEELYQRKKGLTFFSSDASIDGVIAQGKAPIQDGEEELAYSLSLDPMYQHNNGRSGQPNFELIRAEVNHRIHFGKNVRSRDSIRNMLRRQKDKAKDGK